jgi:Mor family transcriptional regulator
VRSRRLKLYDYVGDVVDAGSAVLLESAELGLDADRARALMLKIAKAICDRHAKSTVYIPEAVNLANIERNARIWAAYQTDGNQLRAWHGGPPTYARRFSPERAQELSLEYDLSTQQIYNIIAQQRAMELDQVQPELPGLEGP